MVQLEKGALLYDQDTPANCWYEIVSGIVRTCRILRDGRRQVTGFHFPGDVFGFDGPNHKTSAEAVTDGATVLDYSGGGTAAQPAIRESAIVGLQRALDCAEGSIRLLGHRSAPERLAAFLLMLRSKLELGSHFVMPMPRTDIADFLGLTVETVSRTLTDFARKRLIVFETPQQLLVEDWARLRDVAGDDEDSLVTASCYSRRLELLSPDGNRAGQKIQLELQG